MDRVLRTGAVGVVPVMLGAVGDDEVGGATVAVGWVEALFRERYAEVLGLATLLLGDRHRAEDVVQDTFAALHARAEPLDEPHRAAGYLARAVVNGCRSQGRRRQVEGRHPPEPPGAARSAEDGAVAADDARAVTAALLLLPDRQRACLVCQHHLGLSHREIAEVLGISAGSVKTHLKRGTARLTHLLEGQR